MRRNNNDILITLNEWLEAGLSEALYKSDKKRGYLKTAGRACYGNGVEIIWSSIVKEVRKQAIISRFGKPEDICSVSAFADSILPDATAQEFFNSYRLPDERFLPAERIAEYVANAEVLSALIRALNDRRGTRRALGGKVTGILKTLTDSANKLDRVAFPHSLPTNERRMRDVINKYKAEGYASLVHKNFTKKYAAKVDTEVKSSLLMELLSDPRNLDNEQIRGMYNIVAEKMGWKKISGSTVGVWRNKMDLVSYAGRRGETSLRNTRTMQVKRSAPTCPLYFWTADGWDVELLYQRTNENKNGVNVTTYHNRLTVVVVLDPCEKYPIGYAIGDHETPELIKEAFRNAINHTAELFGTRHRAHQLQTDHYAAKALSSLYSLVADLHTPARVKNAKAKIIEPYFGHLNRTYCQLMPNWSGFGLTSKVENQPNVDYINKHKNMFPDFEGCREQIARIMELERSRKRAKYLEKWNSTPADQKLPLQATDYLYYFGAATGNTNLLQGSGIRPTINGIVRDYDCFDIRFREHAGVQWQVLYDPDNLGEALAVNESGTLRFLLKEKYVQPMALRDRKEGDSEAFAEVNNFNKLLENSITQKRATSSQLVHGLFNDNPQLDDTLAKLIIVNSHGQHKNERNAPRKRIKASAKEVECVEPVVLASPGALSQEKEPSARSIFSKY